MNLKNLLLLAAAASLSLAVVTGCQSSKSEQHDGMSASSKMVNTKCPYSGTEAEVEHMAMYNGEAVGFCCPMCEAKFNKSSDAEKAVIVAKAKAMK